MGDRSKIEERRTEVHRRLIAGTEKPVTGLLCACSAVAVYEINRGFGPPESFCAEHLPANALR